MVGAKGFMGSRVGYVRYLHATLQARGAIEASLDEAGAAALFPAWPNRRIAEAVRADLRDLGAREPPHVDEGFEVDGLGGVAGALYVLEGSALGARLLSKEAGKIGMHARFGARHMAAQISDPQAWPTFVDALEGLALDADQEAASINGAIQTFACFERALINSGI